MRRVSSTTETLDEWAAGHFMGPINPSLTSTEPKKVVKVTGFKNI
jgi:hypothetical protein